MHPDGERFFSYRSEKLRSEFPVVIRIVERLKADWGDKTASRARQITEAASATGTTEITQKQGLRAASKTEGRALTTQGTEAAQPDRERPVDAAEAAKSLKMM